MATEKEMYEIIDIAVADIAFREMLMADSEKVVTSLDYSVTPEQIASLKESGIGKISDELLPESQKWILFWSRGHCNSQRTHINF